MQHRLVRALVALTAILTVALGVGDASASRSLSVSATSIRLSGPLTIQGTEGGGFSVRCDEVTFLKFVQRSATKILNTQHGEINGILLERCHDSEGHLSNTRPEPCVERRLLERREELTFLCGLEPHWALLYEGFLGSLPNLSGIFLSILGVSEIVEIPILGVRCGYRGTAYAKLEVTEGTITGYRLREERIALERTAGGMLCPRAVTMRGTLIPPAEIRLILV